MKLSYHNVILLVLTFSLPIEVLCKLDVIANSINGTENLRLILTDKQLAIQKYLVGLTLLQDHNNNKSINDTKFGWKGWESNYFNDQRNLPSVRYPLAFVGYTIAALIYKTPAYRELSIKTLDNVIQRLLEEHQYKYIEFYWTKLKSFPDPVYHENIMYSGHLAMLIALYESLSGDLKYTQEGWYFTWNNENKFHYNSKMLMDAIYNQVNSEESGGVACEPNSIFVICNNHHRIAYLLYDAIHGTNYSISNNKWEDWLKHHGRAPDVLPDGDYRYFRIIYYRPLHVWIPLYGTSGNDAWALTFMNSWINDKEFAIEGYEQMLKSKQWKKVSNDEEYLDAGYFGKISELNSWLASSLFPSVENQYSDKNKKTVNIYNWFERNFGAFDTFNCIGCNNSYFYRINDTEYLIWTTANLLFSMITDNDTFNEMYNRPFYSQYGKEPELQSIDYPNLHVKYAFYDKDASLLNFGLKTDCFDDIYNTEFIIKNTDSLVKALLIIESTVIDITSHGVLDSLQKQIQFSNINITFDAINEFKIFF